MIGGVTRRPAVIFGASGFVGAHVRRSLAAWPSDRTVVSRRPIETGPGEACVQGDLMSPEGLAGRLPEGAVVINLAYDSRGGHDANMAAADGLAHVCRAIGAVRLVHVSSAVVVGASPDRIVTESTPCRPLSPYQRTKLAVEQRLEERLPATCSMIVLRPTVVFGRGGLNLRKLARDLRDGPAYRNYLRSSLFGRRPMNLVPVETVAAAVRFAATSDRTPGSDHYLVADDVPENNFRDVEATLRKALGLGPYSLPRLPMPAAALSALQRVTGRFSGSPWVTFSGARLRQAGFVGPADFAAALAVYAAELAAEPVTEARA